MKIIADLHIHSRFSRATSKDLNIKNLENYAKIKGLNLLGTGDFTHPEWIKELKQELAEDGSGILKTKQVLILYCRQKFPTSTLRMEREEESII
jgi:PHP family Zn ribbon phosphoesterase